VSLFRQQAVDAQFQRLEGEVLTIPGRLVLSAVAGLCLWAVVALWWLSTSDYVRRESVRGWLEPAAGVVRVYPRITGSVTAVHVAPGDTVRAGQTLISLQGDQHLPSGHSLETGLMAQYERQQELLLTQFDSLRAERVTRSEKLRLNIAATQRHRDATASQQEIVARQLALLQSQLARLEQLHTSGHVALSELERIRAEELRLRVEAHGLDTRWSEYNSSIQQLQLEQRAHRQQTRREESILQEKASLLRQQIAALQGRRHQLVVAPRAGVVENLRVRVGQRVAGAEAPLLHLMPLDGTLRAALLVPARSIGFLSPGQSVKLRYDAFPYQKYGLSDAEIVAVARSVQLPQELSFAPIAVGEAVYRVDARLGQAAIAFRGQTHALKSGMTLVADVELDRRSLLRWLLDPLDSLRARL
jgi:membrane fusion protein